jgi:hypothetical protein
MTPDPEADALREQSPPYAPPPQTKRLIDELYREELREARAMRPEQKLLLGEELFIYACSITMAGIRNQFPDADEGLGTGQVEPVSTLPWRTPWRVVSTGRAYDARPTARSTPMSKAEIS